MDAYNDMQIQADYVCMHGKINKGLINPCSAEDLLALKETQPLTISN